MAALYTHFTAIMAHAIASPGYALSAMFGLEKIRNGQAIVASRGAAPAAPAEPRTEPKPVRDKPKTKPKAKPKAKPKKVGTESNGAAN